MARKRVSTRAKPRRKTAAKEDASDLTLELKLVRLVESKANLAIAGRQFPRNASVIAGVEGANPKAVENGFELRVRVTADITGTADDNKGSRLEILCRYEVISIAPREPTKDEVKRNAFAAAHIAWPYLREFVSSVSSRMGALPVVLPLLRVNPDEGMQLLP